MIVDSRILQFDIDFSRINPKLPSSRAFIKEGDIYKPNPDYVKADNSKYLQDKKEYIAKRIFEEIGYQEYLIYCNKNHLDSSKYLPCESADSQCNIYCKKFNLGE